MLLRFHSLGDKNCDIMLGHYFLFLCHVNLCLFLFIFTINAKWNNIHFGTVGNKRNSDLVIFLDMLLPVLNWLCTKYQFHLPLELLIYTSALLIGHVAYFYSLLWAGTIAILSVNGSISITYIFQTLLTGMKLNSGSSQ